MIIKRVLLVILFCITTSIFAEGYNNNEKFNMGFYLWSTSYSKAESITGGTYLKGGLSLIFNSRLYWNTTVDTNIVSDSFEDKLLNSELSYQLFGLDDFGSSIGVAYLTNINNFADINFFGLSVTPFHSGKSMFEDDFKMYIALAPFTVFYSPQSEQWLWSLSFIDIKLYF